MPQLIGETDAFKNFAMLYWPIPQLIYGRAK